MKVSGPIGYLSLSFAALVLSFDIAAAVPAVTLSPIAGPPTTSLTVSGTGFSPSAPVDIYFDTTDVGLAIATAGGTISYTVKAPKDAQPQAHWISAVQRSPVVGAQAAFTVRTDWTQFHGLNAKHTGYNPYENTISTSNVRNLDVLWQAPFSSSGTYNMPVVAGGKVYIPSGNKLYAFNNKTGAAIGGFPKTLGGSQYFGSAAIGGAIVYVGADDDKLYAFNAGSGVVIPGFPVTISGGISTSPAVANGNVYVTGSDGRLYAFNATTGAVVPGFPAIVDLSYGLGTPTVANGRVYVGSFNDNFYAFDATSGAYRWSFASAGSFSPAAVSARQIYTGSTDTKVYGVRAHDGVAVPGFPITTSGSINSSTPAIGDGQLIIATNNGSTGTIYSFDLSSGVGQWSRGLDYLAYSSPVIANGIVYVNSLYGLYALNQATGSVLWRAAAPANVSSSPVVADGIVYFPSSDGNLYAFSVNGVFPSLRLPGGELGVKPAISSLKPNYSLKATRS